MIAELRLGRERGGVREVRFVPRASIPLEAACLVANGVREALRELLGVACELVLGEPVALAPEAWTRLAADSSLFLTRGRQTDIVLLLARGEMRGLVLRAFGEGDPLPPGACSALELYALERIAERCAHAFDPLCAQRTAPARAVEARDAPPCVAYFDLRVRAPFALSLGIGVVRDLPDPGPSGTAAAVRPDGIPLRACAVVGRAALSSTALARVQAGDVFGLDGGATLEAGGCVLARGRCGVSNGRAAFAVDEAYA